MIQDFLAPFAWFAFVTSITPGPNNLMLMASGANYGLRRTVPHMLGISIGFAFMVAMVGVGLVQVFDAFPWSYTALRIVSVVYLLWLAWKIANAAPPEHARSGAGSPLTFVQAAAFQWVNPKAWAMALSAVTIYAPDRSLGSSLLVAVVFGAVNLPSVGVWAVIGVRMQRLLTDRARLKAFNVSMALLLVASPGLS